MTPYYEDSAVRLYLGDCRDVLPSLRGSYEAVLTDPPYGVEFVGKNTKHTKRDDSGYDGTHDSPEFVRLIVVPVVASLIAEGVRIVVTPGSRNVFEYPKPDGMGTVFYPSGAGLGRWGFVCSQPILYYGKDPHLAAGKGHRPDSFSSTEAAEENGHPCPKPIGTMLWLVRKVSMPGECILDPFAGSGTTLVAAKQQGRKAIGIEINEAYCEIAAKRLSQGALPLEFSA